MAVVLRVILPTCVELYLNETTVFDELLPFIVIVGSPPPGCSEIPPTPPELVVPTSKLPLASSVIACVKLIGLPAVPEGAVYHK